MGKNGSKLFALQRKEKSNLWYNYTDTCVVYVLLWQKSISLFDLRIEKWNWLLILVTRTTDSEGIYKSWPSFIHCTCILQSEINSSPGVRPRPVRVYPLWLCDTAQGDNSAYRWVNANISSHQGQIKNRTELPSLISTKQFWAKIELAVMQLVPHHCWCACALSNLNLVVKMKRQSQITYNKYSVYTVWSMVANLRFLLKK